MTKAEAQHILIKAFLATKELPREIEALLEILIKVGEGDQPAV
ncbi:hypothetical protein [Sphingomonas sp. CFBP 13714]|nr:hypothetical protein [Sphingomonas sp. CFBP 13714]